MSECPNSGKYDLIVKGYDWGPGVEKIIIHNQKEINPKKLNNSLEDFTVYIEIQALNWTSFPFRLENQGANQKLNKVYACDEEGNKVEGSSSHIALELAVAPDNPFTNPFVYSTDMMNHWQKVYFCLIKNEKLDISISELNRRICPEADQFTIGSSTTDDVTLSYAYWFPKNDSVEKKPLVIWLHGMGEGGKDPYIALLGNKVVNLISDSVQSSFKDTGACVLVPQVDGFWMMTKNGKDKMKDWISDKSEGTVSYFTRALFNLINDFVAENPQIDKNRIYIGGCSNGGYMTVNMLLQYPDYFAAAYPVCEAYPDVRIDEEKLSILAKQRIWFTQSKDDKTVIPNSYVIPTVKRLKDAGAENIHLSLWNDVSDTTGLYKDAKGRPFKYNGHFSWIYTLNNQCEEDEITIFEWLSAQKLGN